MDRNMVCASVHASVPKQCFGPCFGLCFVLGLRFTLGLGALVLFGTLRSTTEAWSALGSLPRSVLRFRVRVKVNVRIRVRVSWTTDHHLRVRIRYGPKHCMCFGPCFGTRTVLRSVLWSVLRFRVKVHVRVRCFGSFWYTSVHNRSMVRTWVPASVCASV